MISAKVGATAALIVTAKSAADELVIALAGIKLVLVGVAEDVVRFPERAEDRVRGCRAINRRHHIAPS
jgi:hypothetical protein